jgi:hypothetical protein
MADVRKAAELVRLHDQAVEWREAFEADKHARAQPYIQFGEITGRRQADGMGEGNGWDDQLIVPRSVAIEMMRWLEHRALAELKRMGVRP